MHLKDLVWIGQPHAVRQDVVKKQKQGTALGIRDKTNSRNMCNVHERLHALSVFAHAVADSERGR